MSIAVPAWTAAVVIAYVADAGRSIIVPSFAIEASRPVIGWSEVQPRAGDQLRCRGSRRSRKASPNRLVPNTTRLIARPGKITSHGAVRTYSAADSDSMRPQDGHGSGTPRPRNDNDASVRMVEPSCAVARTISGASVFGITWTTA